MPFTSVQRKRVFPGLCHTALKGLLAAATLFIGVANADQALTTEAVQTMPASSVEANLPSSHPAMYYAYAQRLFSEGHKAAAVQWFYIGQLRFRFYLASHPQLPEDGDPALMASLNESLGQVINGWAGGDPHLWVARIDGALDWDERMPNHFTSKDQHAAKWKQVRAGLKAMRDHILTNADSIKAQHDHPLD